MPKLGFIGRLLGDSNEKELKRLSSIVDEINSYADEIAALSDEALAAKSAEFKEGLAADETLEDLLPEAFAVAREMSLRKVGERPYDVQLMGGITLHEGRIAEMRTGEGKTLTAISPVYLNALAGRGVHVITVNDYLARRDATWYGPIYVALGMTVGVIQNNGVSYMYEPGYRPGEEGSTGGLEDLRPCSRRDVYRADITYGTNNEFGFDYLRDNMVREWDDKAQRPLYFAIIDEVDNILIDEARTPLIISGNAEEASGTYVRFARAVKGLEEERDFQIDHKSKHIALTEAGISRVERNLGIENVFGGDPRLARHLEASLDAEFLKRVDRDYVVKDGEIIIVDEFTGRLMPGRRWSHGIHQACEAKEGVPVQRESITYATITFQNLFRLYEKLAGMTGTAETEAEEFSKIYNLDVVVIPTHRPMVREDHQDVVYINERAKFNAVVGEIEEMHTAGRPVLVGTTSIEKSEYLAGLLQRKGIAHEVLNAKQHEREAHIIADAGKNAAVTIATNMAGRGTDIKLGPGIAELGGLHVIGTERHESRRIDNQLRGRAGRQGDPGSSRFFVSFGDDIMKRFSPEWVPGMMQKLGMTEEMPLESRMVTRAIEQAQTKVEGHNFDIRKRLVEFDDVINEHRKQIYTQRDMILQGVDTRVNVIDHMLLPEIERITKGVATNDIDSLELVRAEIGEILPADDVPPIQEMQDLGEELCDEILDRAEDRYEAIEAAIGEESVRKVEHWLLLEAIDTHWREHLTAIEELRQSIGLQAYAQIDPLVAFKREGHDMYQQLVANIQRQVARTVFKVRIVQQDGQAVASHPAATPAGAPPENGAVSEPAAKKAVPVLAKSTGPSDEQIRTLGGGGQNAPKGKGSNAAKRRKMIR
ncbi:MAG: preprotein translocase subunit SecA [Dehalococcoidia bacterium]|uniref:preprotein translocase subunit SecA n=1 Tax=Candidatus Amarobacter glycogenicus TaxID=3140699 RepID=UPI002A0E437D|nr:preprotein translocase subunit SecA [Dehalococcoidia bacterium]MBK7127115.1 preprotein translocase subunit SecA [Dehalococcoidia bacterium]MBK9547418.1 preprotein translocase subunit SecA [Dehalococcoidia bacterium]MBK9612123.1 preprotein translocase subunit SecA [Dehalococcoidia bacterium]